MVPHKLISPVLAWQDLGTVPSVSYSIRNMATAITNSSVSGHNYLQPENIHIWRLLSTAKSIALLLCTAAVLTVVALIDTTSLDYSWRSQILHNWHFTKQNVFAVESYSLKKKQLLQQICKHQWRDIRNLKKQGSMRPPKQLNTTSETNSDLKNMKPLQQN